MTVTYTAVEAAAVTGLSESTVRRRLRAGAFPSAVKEGGEWRIPVNDLTAAVGSGAVSVDLRPAQRPAADDQADEVVELRLQLAAARAEAARWQAVATEREVHVEDLRTALRMLMPAPGSEPAATAERVEQEPKRHWWQRRRGPAGDHAASTPGERTTRT